SGDPQTVRRTYNVNAQEYADFVKAVARRYSGAFLPKYGIAPPPEQTHSNDSDLIHGIIGGGGGGGSAARTAAVGDGFPYNLLGGGAGGSGSGSGSGGTQSTTTQAP